MQYDSFLEDIFLRVIDTGRPVADFEIQCRRLIRWADTTYAHLDADMRQFFFESELWAEFCKNQ